MTASGQRLTGRITVALPPSEAFRLFTPRGEQEWAHGWHPRFPAPVLEDDEPGTVFETDAHGQHTTWVITGQEPGRRISYARVTPGEQAGIVTVTITGAGDHSEVEVCYQLTALTPAGGASSAYSPTGTLPSSSPGRTPSPPLCTRRSGLGQAGCAHPREHGRVRWPTASRVAARQPERQRLVQAHDADRTVAWSWQLAQAHAALRRQLRDVQADPGSASAGGWPVTHCLAFCSALSAHHHGEDGGLFTELLRVRPDLQDVVRKLTEDHELIAGIVATLRDLASEAAGAPPGRRQVIGREFAGLAAIMESHFGYEERAISEALDDGVQDTGWTTAVFDVRT